jgi:hypothetical protein
MVSVEGPALVKQDTKKIRCAFAWLREFEILKWAHGDNERQQFDDRRRAALCFYLCSRVQ